MDTNDRCGQAGVPVPPVAHRLLVLELAVAHGAVIVEKQNVLLEMTLEAEATVLQIHKPLTPYRLCQPHGLSVLLLVLPPPIQDEIQLQVFITPLAIDIDVKIQ